MEGAGTAVLEGRSYSPLDISEHITKALYTGRNWTEPHGTTLVMSASAMPRGSTETLRTCGGAAAPR